MKRKRVVVTGAASGMGRATFAKLAGLDSEVIALDCNPVDADIGPHLWLRVDLSNPESIQHAVSSIHAPVDALVNCAGISGKQGHTPEQVWKTNFLGPKLLTELLLMRHIGRGGSIVSVASGAGAGYWRRSQRYLPLFEIADMDEGFTWCKANRKRLTEPYTSTKEAIIVWMQHNVRSLAERGIRINVVNPGLTDTAMMPDFLAMAGGDESALKQLAGAPGRGNATPEEIANILVFLINDEASIVNGHVMAADGGWLGSISTDPAADLLHVVPPNDPEVPAK